MVSYRMEVVLVYGIWHKAHGTWHMDGTGGKTSTLQQLFCSMTFANKTTHAVAKDSPEVDTIQSGWKTTSTGD